MEQRQDQRMQQEHHGLMWLIRESDFQAVEALATLVLLAWSILLFLPVDTFSRSQSFVVMAAWATEGSWARVGMALFVGHLASVVVALWCAHADAYPDLCRWSRRSRIAFVFLIFTWWVFISLMLLVAAPFSTGGYAYAALALGAFWAFLRLLGRKHLD